MKKQLTDEQFDALMRTLVNEATADQAVVNEIADSPATWWGVQRKINEQKTASKSPWPPVGKGFRWLTAAFAATAAAVLVISLSFLPDTRVDDSPVATNVQAAAPIDSTPAALTEPEKSNIFPTEPVVNPTKQAKRKTVPAKLESGARPSVCKPVEAKTIAPAKDEIKTEFIALSYARDPDSGQIVRVKVPRALMVSLGVVGSDRTPSGMVDAEVLVGDDGLTRAIRFIR